MFKLINTANGNTIGYTNNPRYIKISSNGSYVQASEKEALGIAYLGNPYNLAGTDGLDVEVTASLLEINEDYLLNSIESLMESIGNIEDALCELDKEEQVNE